MKTLLENLRWTLADWLSRIACWLRGQKWYETPCYGIHGNRAADLAQSIWEDCVLLDSIAKHKDTVWMQKLEMKVRELAQLAGENWGHK